MAILMVGKLNDQVQTCQLNCVICWWCKLSMQVCVYLQCLNCGDVKKRHLKCAVCHSMPDNSCADLG